MDWIELDLNLGPSHTNQHQLLHHATSFFIQVFSICAAKCLKMLSSAFRADYSFKQYTS